MNKILGIFFALICVGTSVLSSHIMGAGVWFWIIIVTGVFVAISQFVPVIRLLGSRLAGLLSLISIAAILLGLLAATVGGSFRLEEQEAMLLVLFFLIALFGITLSVTSKY